MVVFDNAAVSIVHSVGSDGVGSDCFEAVRVGSEEVISAGVGLASVGPEAVSSAVIVDVVLSVFWRCLFRRNHSLHPRP
jgi:hypothetical protein